MLVDSVLEINSEVFKMSVVRITLREVVVGTIFLLKSQNKYFKYSFG